ncbi:DegT/DnrJ/EryC1/StrS family aminotransferase [Acetatifactor muris]|uniref:UDP-2-acetamido-2-deoxy-3-oxo-D-glucuronate aminotransferase n=1 Tax=Acetatifactor muris TaxID=879566 RepID=A0A2K4ZEL0_9FIRM|nr:DegT/DnrJ/EryC1/StrS family aminotransferase [Acetatifactor muris]MCR2048492.1 DegT/DnrJ/EryC1/StrS family aminotransferase [Acetatifactor muris]SOY28884.1 UDP-2-acetamido-2-deoxy-3-oxo-D-glucuronate aminotransferase [Acetatifactor muris]
MEFRDLKKQYAVMKEEIDLAVAEVISSANFISGTQVRKLEEQLAEYVGVKYCITCANGTDAISLALRIWGVGEGDAVFVPDFTFFSSGECPAFARATPIFVDVDDRTYNMDPDRLERAVCKVKAEGKYNAKAIIAVDLFGLPADYDRIQSICKKYDLLLLEDGAQGFGGSIRGRKACSFGDISTTSFFPAKPLGCYGDGGAIFTDREDWAELLRSYCVHGKAGNDKYNNIRIGVNSRLDTIQAAVLLPKLKAFREYELDCVNQVASWYTSSLKNGDLILPEIVSEYSSSWAQYTVQLPKYANRSAVQARLKAAGIPSMVYYNRPMHMQGAFAGTDSAKADCPVTDYICGRVLSLPMHPYLSEEEVWKVSRNLKKALIEE